MCITMHYSHDPLAGKECKLLVGALHECDSDIGYRRERANTNCSFAHVFRDCLSQLLLTLL